MSEIVEQPHPLGAPFAKEHKAKFQEALAARVTPQSQASGSAVPNYEAAVQYTNDVVDRQIAKASGVLSYNAVLFAGIQLPGTATTWARISASLVLASSLLLLFLMYVRWGPAVDYQTAENDFKATCKVAFARAYILTACLALTIVGSVGALFLIWRPGP